MHSPALTTRLSLFTPFQGDEYELDDDEEEEAAGGSAAAGGDEDEVYADGLDEEGESTTTPCVC